MAEWQPVLTVAKPAPFPVYADDSRPTQIRRLLLVLAVLIVLGCQLPKHAGPYDPLALPVRYARLDLTTRQPVRLSLDLPSGDWSVVPASLGYFLSADEFVYTANVSRGVIYGRPDEEIVLLEVSAPPDAELFFEDYLDRIRSGVIEMNRRGNLLKSARDGLAHRSYYQQTADGGSRAAALNDVLGTDLSGPSEEWLAGVLFRHGDQLTDVTTSLVRDARELAQLKQLYYDGQQARLDLMLDQYDLQLAMARLPRQEISELISLGDAHLVRETMLGEIDRLEGAWTRRQAQLKRVVAAERHWLDRAAISQSELPPDPLSAVVGPRLYKSEEDQAPGVPEPEIQLELSLCAARAVVAEGELAAIAAGLDKLAQARAHVDSGVVPDWTELPRLKVEPVPLGPVYFTSLPGFAEVNNASRDAGLTVPLLVELAKAFEEGTDDAVAELARGTDFGLELAAYPHELAYGMMLVDSALRQGDPGALDALGAQLDKVLAVPEDHGLVGRELGYLRFIGWYAGLDSSEVLADTADTISEVPEA